MWFEILVAARGHDGRKESGTILPERFVSYTVEHENLPEKEVSSGFRNRLELAVGRRWCVLDRRGFLRNKNGQLVAGIDTGNGWNWIVREEVCGDHAA
jgi:hypothetical protein